MTISSFVDDFVYHTQLSQPTVGLIQNWIQNVMANMNIWLRNNNMRWKITKAKGITFSNPLMNRRNYYNIANINLHLDINDNQNVTHMTERSIKYLGTLLVHCVVIHLVTEI
eukprot:1009475_1